jgi:hypothetical protein
MKLLKVENEPGMARDPSNQAILSTDLSALQAYKIKRQKTAQIDAALDDINKLKEDMAEIKSLITKLISTTQVDRYNG